MPDLRVLQSFDAAEDAGVDTCMTCPKLCRWSCPVSEAQASETSSPWNLVILGGYLKRGLAAVDSVRSAPYQCTDCGACKEACLHSNDVPLLVSLSRSRVLHGHAAPEPVVEVRGHFGTAGNPYGRSLEAGLQGIVDKANPHGSSAPSPSGALVYMPGCATIHEMPEAAVGFLQALKLNGIGGVAVNDASASCCGLPLLWAGDLNGFVSHARRHAARLANADTVIVHDPACAHTMTTRYAEFGVTLSPEVVHVSRFLAGRLGNGGSAIARVDDAPAYIDSCGLARGLGERDAPRQVIEKAIGVPPRELPNLSGHTLDCCGAGGLLPVTAPATATAMGEARLQAFRATGAKRLVSFSPRCAAHLKRIDPLLDIVDGSMLLTKV